MPINRYPFLAGIIVLLLSACVPLPQYMKIEKKLEASRKTLKENSLELSRCAASTAKQREKLKNLETQNAYLKKINQQLLENMNRLKRDLNKKNTVIQLQGKVIRIHSEDTSRPITP